jgi:ATP/maltotriose-dependent transcriptional regulator MalT
MPQIQDSYPRERLHSLLDRCLERTVVWISGPGGGGKSTLVAQYLELRSLPALWYQGDSGQNRVRELLAPQRNLL